MTAMIVFCIATPLWLLPYLAALQPLTIQPMIHKPLRAFLQVIVVVRDFTALRQKSPSHLCVYRCRCVCRRMVLSCDCVIPPGLAFFFGRSVISLPGRKGSLAYGLTAAAARQKPCNEPFAFPMLSPLPLNINSCLPNSWSCYCRAFNGSADEAFCLDGV